jgi:hypothetical protein
MTLDVFFLEARVSAQASLPTRDGVDLSQKNLVDSRLPSVAVYCHEGCRLHATGKAN